MYTVVHFSQVNQTKTNEGKNDINSFIYKTDLPASVN